MHRIPPIDPATAEEKTKKLFQVFQDEFEMIPNFIRTLGHSPAALEGYLKTTAALSKGFLDVKLQEGIALSVAELNQCKYCTSLHKMIAKAAGVTNSELQNNRMGHSKDIKIQTVLQFVKTVVNSRGHVSEVELKPLRHAGYTDPEIVEIIAHIGLNIFTNYLNSIAGTASDFL